MKTLITTVPFGEINKLPLELLADNQINYVLNPLNRKLTEDELAEMVSEFDTIIAGTEMITKKVLDPVLFVPLLTGIVEDEKLWDHKNTRILI